jgi:hypothetical protein
MKTKKLYNPDKCSSFKMQFGFEAPLKYISNNRRKKPINYEDKRKSEVLVKDVS